MTNDKLLIREIARLNHINAGLQIQVFNLSTQTTGEPDRILLAEWRGQEIAFQRMMNTIDGKDA